jgi:hypothetical protein
VFGHGAVVQPCVKLGRDPGEAANGEHPRRPVGNRLRGALVTAEIAFSLCLVVAAALLVRSYDRLQAENRGFSAADVLKAQITLPDTKNRGGLRYTRKVGHPPDEAPEELGSLLSSNILSLGPTSARRISFGR